MSLIRLGTRGSALALAQARAAAELIRRNRPDLEVELVTMRTSGDRKQGAGEGVVRDKKDWILELEEAILAGEIDLAIHSGKDVPVEISAETVLAPVLEREDPRDALLLNAEMTTNARDALLSLPSGARVGTASLRRKAQLLRIRPDLQIVPVRGNVPTRLERLRQGAFDALVLACAGLHRLGLNDAIAGAFSPEDLVPAVNQGVLSIQWGRNGRFDSFFSELTSVSLGPVWAAERSCLTTLGADCDSAVGIFAERDGTTLTIRGRVLSADGRRCLEHAERGAAEEAAILGTAVANTLLSSGAAELL